MNSVYARGLADGSLRSERSAQDLAEVYVCALEGFFLNGTATTEIYTLSLHDALPISHTVPSIAALVAPMAANPMYPPQTPGHYADRKSTRLNSSHANTSYAVFCL